MRTNGKKLIVVLGPTASGKSELAIKLAKKFKGEIVSADSRQVYRGMDIATAKPSRSQKSLIAEQLQIAERPVRKVKSQKYLVNGIPHYLIDIASPNQEFNVAIYKKLAIKAIKDIQKRGKLPFLVGGTGLYIQAVVDNIEFPKVPPKKKLREKLEKKSVKELFEVYKSLDPKGAKFIEKENKRRLIRAIEVSKVTGKPFWQQREKGKPLFDILKIGLKLTKEELKKKISKRVERMIKMGLEKEVKKLVKKYDWIPPLQTIGYQEWREYFERKIDKKEVQRLISQHTIQFAKRQMTWFKRGKRIHWLKTQREAERLIKEFLKK